MNNIVGENCLRLIRRGIGHMADAMSMNLDWTELQAFADKQGLAAIVLDGIEGLPIERRPPQEMLLEWIGEVLQGYEYRYEQYEKAISELAGFYSSHGYKMMILKGYACSLDWPKPSHRPCGDIDIWQFGKQKEADEAVANEKGIKIDNSHHHHTVFEWKDFSVENHYDFINVHHHKSNAELETLFKKLGQDDSHYIGVNGERVYLPSPNLHALFLLKHTMNDFTTSSVTIRQVLDWAFFVEKNSNEIDWNWLKSVMEEYHMMDFYNCLNAICVQELGFEASIFHGVQFNPTIKEKVLNEILYPKFERSEPKWLIPRLRYKYRRWKANEWKRNICYSDNGCSSFWSGIWNHLLKPATI